MGAVQWTLFVVTGAGDGDLARLTIKNIFMSESAVVVGLTL